MTPLSIDGLSAPKVASEPGPAPMLQWIAIGDLVIDETYQRHVARRGKANIAKIAGAFRWSHFAPVIVSPVEGGKFAIVDGQHRTTAAMLVGVDAVPCQVIVAGPTEQAAAFSAINGNITRIHPLALHKAAVAAGDAQAMAIDRVAREGGARVLPYPKSELHQAPGETMAISTLGDCIALRGEALVVLALRCLLRTHNRIKGGLTAPIVGATVDAIVGVPNGVNRPDELIAAFGRINVIREYGKAQSGERARGMSIRKMLAGRLSAALAVELREAA